MVGSRREESGSLELLNDIIEEACRTNLFTQTTLWITHTQTCLYQHTGALSIERTDLNCIQWGQEVLIKMVSKNLL